MQIKQIETSRGLIDIREATSRDIEQFHLGVTGASTSAVHCYQRCGFTICGTQPRGLFYDGKYYDGYFMFKLLDDL